MAVLYADTEVASNTLADRLARRELHLPLLPRTATAVLELTLSDDGNAGQLAQLIEGDPALAGNIMRVANSAVYRGASPFVSLQQVIARLGMTTISEIALATTLNSDMFPSKRHEERLSALWHGALTVAAWSRELARLQRQSAELTFLGGMLCQVGKPVVVQGLEDLDLMPATLDECIERFHVQAGAILADTWELPPIVLHAILHHESPDSATDFIDEVRNIHAAVVLSRPDVDVLPDHLAASLNLYEDDVAALAERSTAVREWVRAMES